MTCRHVAVECIMSGESADDLAGLMYCVIDSASMDKFEYKGGPECEACIIERQKEMSVDERAKTDPCNDYTKSNCSGDPGCEWLRDCKHEEHDGLCVSRTTKCPSGGGTPSSGPSSGPSTVVKFPSMDAYSKAVKKDTSLDKDSCKGVGGKFKGDKCVAKAKKIEEVEVLEDNSQ